MSSVAEARGTRPIAASIVALVIGAVLASTIVLFVVTFNGPPPMAKPIRIESIVAALKGLPSPDHPPPGMRGPPDRLFLNEGSKVLVQTSGNPPAPSPRARRLPALEQRIAAALGAPRAAVAAWSDRPPPFRTFELEGDFVVVWHQPDGRWRVARPAPRPLITSWHKATMAAMLIAVLALSLPAWIIARAISRPLRRLATAAEQARAGAERPDFPADGPAEVRALTGAVSAMHDRLSHHAEGRTAMLAAIAHDLGTPLSRLAFWIEQLPEGARNRASSDIDEMRAMIGDTLAFARDEAGERDTALVDLGSLLDSLVEDMSVGGAAVTLEPGPRAVVRGDPRSLRRAFANLIGNALRYGERARARWRIDGRIVTIEVEDDGPGIDPAQAERLFEPFVRGEASRNRATGGTGLGLAIVRTIAARHAGTATLANRAGGGAIAKMTLPLER
ncbi:ATP-binding protein [Sphingomonas sp. SUN019]|uniref:ATP-binding protein n=1 Tax=Sphingomonas sp. SUN019 TaxID=2937788 RepID=UPI00216414B4|nr:ATP-binding protein [Sphingomonas sp. SUN019]UVO49053.1 ATP-binding protein [Sphingomonas sp. SUN019]